MPIEGMKTLMYSTTDEPPMMINIDPPSVIVTTRFAIGILTDRQRLPVASND